VLVSRAWLEQHDLMSVADIVKTAQKNQQFLASLASEVAQAPKK
jgi:hypothetical protein